MAPTASDEDAAPGHREGAPTASFEALLERLRELTAGPALDDQTAPQALQTVLDSIRLKHGALFTFNSDQQSLTLLTHKGLSPQAREAVQVIRRGIGGVWDMPLHSVLQRRVYLIEKPRENPFIPVLLEGADQGLLRNVAVMPLFASGAVTGALLLIGSGAVVVRDTDVVALREHVKLLGAALRHSAKPARSLHALPRPLAAESRSEPDSSAKERAALSARVIELEAVVESLRRTTAEQPAAAAEWSRRLGEVTRERDRLEAQVAFQEIGLLELRAELDAVRDRAEAEAGRAESLSAELASAREELAFRLESAKIADAERQRFERLSTETDRRLSDVDDRLAEALDHGRSLEAERAALAARVASAEGALQEVRSALGVRDAEIVVLRAERERLAGALQGSVSRLQEAESSLAVLRDNATESAASERAEIEALQSRLDRAERERDQLRAGARGREEVVREIERETEGFRAELRREQERRRAAEQTSAAVLHDAATLRTELERSLAAAAEAGEDAERLRADGERLAAELTKSRQENAAALQTLERDGSRLRATLTEAETQRTALAAEVEGLRGELSRRVREEENLRRRGLAANDEGQRLRTETADVRRSLETAGQSLRAITEERDSLALRAASLQETTSGLLREAEAERAELARRTEEAERLRTLADERAAQIDAQGTELAALRAAGGRAEEALEAGRASTRQQSERTAALERQLETLRQDLERAQARGSELTLEVEERRRREDELGRAEADLHAALAVRDERLREADGARRAALARLEQLQESLRGASVDLAAKDRELETIASLRAGVAKAEAGRRAAEERIGRLETAIEAERRTLGDARGEAENERQNAREIAARMRELELRARDAEKAAAEAAGRASTLAAEHAAAVESAKRVASELGRRSAELADLSARLESVDREVRDSRAENARFVDAVRSLEESSRAAAAEIVHLKRQALAAEQAAHKRIADLEIELADSRGRVERVAAELAAAEGGHVELQRGVAELQAERHSAEEHVRASAAKAAEAEAAVARGRAEAEKLERELEALRRRATTLEENLKNVESENTRWRSLAERSQLAREAREREVGELRGPEPAPRPAPTPPRPAAAKPAASSPSGESRPVLVLDDAGSSLQALTEAIEEAGFAVASLDGAPLLSEPRLVALNLLAEAGGLDGLRRIRAEERLRGVPLALYANKPGSPRGIVLANIVCLVRPVEQATFEAALGAQLGKGKRVTIIGEELDSVLRLNGWATSRGCSVSSAGDLKQGNEILDIVKPDLIVFDFSRLGGEGAGLLAKVRRSPRLESLPLLLVLPQSAPGASFFLKRLAMLAEETLLDFAPLVQRLGAPLGASPT